MFDRSIIVTPSAGRITRPLSSNCLITSTTSLLGMANPIPSTLTPEPAELAILLELIPMTWPAILINAPPELPGLMAASV